MSVKVCGHEVRWQKPIKIYTFFKSVALLAVMSAVFVTPAIAAEPRDQKPIQVASTGGADPCNYAPASRMDEHRAIERDIPDRTQRSAGTTLSPAVALALALGYRNVAGPMERSAPPRAGQEE